MEEWALMPTGGSHVVGPGMALQTCYNQSDVGHEYLYIMMDRLVKLMIDRKEATIVHVVLKIVNTNERSYGTNFKILLSISLYF